MKPNSVLRKATFAAHVVFSVGWLGAVVAYLLLAVMGLATAEPQMARAIYLVLEPIGWFAIVPMSVAALATGLVQSLVANWGLLRHYWIVVKLGLNVVAILVLLRHMELVGKMADIAETSLLSPAEFRPERMQLVVHPAAGLLVLLAVVALSVFKPWGLTPLARRRQTSAETVENPGPTAAVPPMRGTGEFAASRITLTTTVGKLCAVHAILAFVLLIVVLHLRGAGFPHH